MTAMPLYFKPVLVQCQKQENIYTGTDMRYKNILLNMELKLQLDIIDRARHRGQGGHTSTPGHPTLQVNYNKR